MRDDEAVGERAVGRLDREVALVALHRVLEDLARHLEELLVERADGDGRPLDQVHDLGKRLLGNDGAGAELLGDGLDALAQQLGALARGRRRRGRARARARSRSAAGTSMAPGARKRWPYVMRPAVRPANSTGTTSPPNSASSQRTGREKRASPLPHRCDFGHSMFSASRASSAGSTSTAETPLTSTVA